MPVPADFQASMDAVDNATNKLGTGVTSVSTAVDGVSIRVAALIAKISTSMTAADVATVKGVLDAETTKLDNASLALDAIATSLTGIAADATDPVPTPVPEPRV